MCKSISTCICHTTVARSGTENGSQFMWISFIHWENCGWLIQLLTIQCWTYVECQTSAGLISVNRIKNIDNSIPHIFKFLHIGGISKVNIYFKNLQNQPDHLTFQISVGHSIFMSFRWCRAAGWYEINFNLKLISTQNITSSPLTLCSCLSFCQHAADSTTLAAVFHRATNDPVITNPAADVGATAACRCHCPNSCATRGG